MIFFNDSDLICDRNKDLQEIHDQDLIQKLSKHFDPKKVNPNEPIILGSTLQSNTCNEHRSLFEKPIGLEY